MEGPACRGFISFFGSDFPACNSLKDAPDEFFKHIEGVKTADPKSWSIAF
jgi:hypothetical protein